MLLSALALAFFPPLILLIAILIYQSRCKFYKTLKKIPGPPSLPILGNIFDVKLPPDKFFLKLREIASLYKPICKLWGFHLGTVLLYSPDDIEIVLSNVKYIEKGVMYNFLHHWLGTGLLTSDGKKWHSRRKLLTPAFHFNVLRDFVQIFNEESSALVKTLKKHTQDESVVIMPHIVNYTLLTIAQTSLGTKLEPESQTYGDYKRAIHYIGQVFAYRSVRPWLYINSIFSMTWYGLKTHFTIKQLHKFTTTIIKKSKANWQSDESNPRKRKLGLLDLLLTAQQNGEGIDDEGIREEVDTFVFEGHDTTSAIISLLLLTLANHQEVQNEMRQEIIDLLGESTENAPTHADLQNLPYTERCIKECLRLFPSVPLIVRKASEDIPTATGYVIPKGAQVFIQIYDLHRDPDIYPDPEKFDPDRFLPENIKNRHPFAYIPFSAGPRNCIGQKFAMLEIKALLCGVLRDFVLEPVDRIEDVDFTLDLVLRYKNDLRVKIVERKRTPNLI